MKDMASNLFQKPKVLFMLIVICLGPPAPIIQTIQACPPDCTDEEELFEAAEDNYKNTMEAFLAADKALLDALKDRRNKRDEYNKERWDPLIAGETAVLSGIGVVVAPGIILKVVAVGAFFGSLYPIPEEFEELFTLADSIAAAKTTIQNAKVARKAAKEALAVAAAQLSAAKAAYEACMEGG